MAFTDAELFAIKRELGYPLLENTASPYIGITSLFEVVINANIAAEVTTTSTLSSAISAASSPTPQTLTLASATGFSSGAVVYVDVDSRQERATIQSLSGSDIVVLLQKAHSGTIPVSLDGPIPIAKSILRRISEVKDEMAQTFGEGAIKKVDEIEWYGHGWNSTFGNLGTQLKYWRSELASILGVQNMWDIRTGGSCSVSVY